jgi:hypothetical protein
MLILIAAMVFIAGPDSAATAGTVKGDIAEHMYFRRTSDATQPTPERAAFQAELKAKEAQMTTDFRHMRQRDALRHRTARENYDYVDAIEGVEAMINGLTTEKEVMIWMGAPFEIVSNDVIMWHQTSGRIAYHINRDFYPAPDMDQKVIAKKFYYKEGNTPREGLAMEVLFTVNQDTGVVEHRAYYFGTGDILPLWKVDAITSG